MIRIFCDRKEKDLKNFWSHIVFHPTDAIEDDWGKAHLERMAADQAVRSVRIYTIFEEIFTLDAQGQLQADFSKNDYRIDFLLSKYAHTISCTNSNNWRMLVLHQWQGNHCL